MEYNYHLMYQKEIGDTEPDTKALFSQSPSLVFLHEVVISYLQELAFYLLKLKELGITSEQVKEDFINAISGMIIAIEYNQEQFFKTITKLYANLSQAKELYISVCQKNNLEAKFFRSIIKNPQKLTLTSAINQGQKLFTLKYKKLTPEQMSLYEFILNIVKSICIHWVELRELETDDEKTYDVLLSLISINDATIFLQKSHEIIKELVEVDKLLLEKLHEVKIERYGEMEPAEVSLSTRPNKAILVSGTNLKELELILEATKDKNIDIYTHGYMLSAHTYPKFKTYHNLVGHFGRENGSYLLDFSDFPGTIFLTRHSFLRVENLCQSSIYTSDVIAPGGTAIVANHNYDSLIVSAHRAEGFTEGITKHPIKLNLSESKILEKIAEVAQKIEKGEIKHFFAIGVSNHTKIQKDYFEKFLNLLGDDCFVLSFSYTNNKNNVLLAESDYGFPILYKALKILTRNLSVTDLNPIVFFTRCEIHTISNVIYLKNIGINKIYFTDCSPNFANPALINAMKNIFDIKSYTSPEEDLKAILANGYS